jgi:hypothetical protein
MQSALIFCNPTVPSSGSHTGVQNSTDCSGTFPFFAVSGVTRIPQSCSFLVPRSVLDSAQASDFFEGASKFGCYKFAPRKKMRALGRDRARLENEKQFWVCLPRSPEMLRRKKLPLASTSRCKDVSAKGLDYIATRCGVLRATRILALCSFFPSVERSETLPFVAAIESGNQVSTFLRSI